MQLHSNLFSLGSSLEAWWTATRVQQHVKECVPPRQPTKTHERLSRFLDATIYDVSAFGSVPALIQDKVTSKEHENSFLVTDLTPVVEQFDQWYQELPMVEPFYAVKCNPDPTIVRLLSALGCGFDCATQGEIDMVMNGLGHELSFSNNR